MSFRGSKVAGIVRGGFWLYCTTLVNNVSGFAYWIIISSIGGSAILGFASAVIGFSALINGFLSLGIGVGTQRFLGKYIGEESREQLLKYFWTSLFFAFLMYFIASITLLFLSNLGISFGAITSDILKVSSILVMLGFAPIFTVLLVSFLRTDVLFYASVIGNLMKLVIGTSLVYLGWGWVGVVIGYLCVALVTLIISIIYVLRLIGFKFIFSLSALRNVIIAGIVSWLPGIIFLIGQWLGVLAVFSYVGASATGYYYVAFVISGFVTAISVSLIRLLIPVLSSMKNGRKRTGWRVLRIGLVLMLPIATFLIVYSWLPLSLLGKDFVNESLTLTVLLLSSVPIAISSCVVSLLYSYGKYLYILFAGLSQTIPRLILYKELVPYLGGLGSAFAYSIGAFIGLAYTLSIAHKIGFHINLREIGVIVGIPAFIATLTYLTNTHWAIAIPLFLTSYLTYVKVGVLTKEDIKDLVTAFLPREKAWKLYETLKPLADFLLH